MFNNLSFKLKISAWVILILGIIATLALSTISFVNAGKLEGELQSVMIWTGILYLVLGALGSSLVSWIIYAIAEVHENVESSIEQNASLARTVKKIDSTTTNNVKTVLANTPAQNASTAQKSSFAPSTPEHKAVAPAKPTPTFSFFKKSISQEPPAPVPPREDLSKYKFTGQETVALRQCSFEEAEKNRSKNLALLVRLLTAKKIPLSTYENYKRKIESGKYTLDII